MHWDQNDLYFTSTEAMEHCALFKTKLESTIRNEIAIAVKMTILLLE